jgi:predicted TIM-barrel fold metal-dependent hydrolase
VRVDIHQHVWTASLVDALAARDSPPRVVRVGGEAILESVGEAPWVIDLEAESPHRRLRLVEQDGLDLAVVAISSPVGIEALPRDEAVPLIEAHLAGVQALGPRFAAWGPIALDRPTPADVDRVLDIGCVGVSLPAGAIATPERLESMRSVLNRVAERGAPLFVHPGPSPRDHPPTGDQAPRPTDPPWWKAMTSYVSQMQAAWLSLAALGRPEHPELTSVFAMLAGGAPLLSERLAARGGPLVDLGHPRTFYDTSSVGPVAIDAIAAHVGEDRLIYGSDRPVIEPVRGGPDVHLQENAARLVAVTGCPA